MELIDIEKLKAFLSSRVTMMTDYDNGICESCIDEYIDEFMAEQQTAEPCEIEQYVETCEECGFCDTISRQAAIDDIRTMNPKDAQLDIKWVEMWLKQLPPAQPETHDKRTETHACDSISRQAALDVFDDYNVAVENGQIEAYSRDRKRLCELPPATPKQRTGKWIYQIGMIKCNQCLRAIRRIDHDGLLNFCPNCGAKMEGDAE